MRKLQGQTDIPLNDTGIRQARQMAEQLKKIPFQGILYSPLLRARQTAKIIYNCLKQEKKTTEQKDKERKLWKKEEILLMEQDYGSANGLPITFSDDEWEQWFRDHAVGAETDRQFEARMYRAAERILENQAESLLVVSHGAVMGKLAEIFTGQIYPISGIGNGEILCLEVEKNRTGRFLYREQKKMEMGYTTGSCAAAAAKAAVWMLLFQEEIHQVSLIPPKKIPLLLELSQVICRKEEASCAICKNGGDDPDVTNGMFIGARAWLTEEAEAEHGYRIPLRNGRILLLEGGEGIGCVTREGLADPVGYPAINPVPRRMIAECVEQVWERADEKGRVFPKRNIRIVIFAPEGRERAKQTFNPHLGIVGGISILGTSGIVEPMSEQALVETIHVDMKQKVSLGMNVLPVVLGNYGEAFLEQSGKGFSKHAVKCSNFIGETVDYAMELSVGGILLTGHLGKMIKLAGGIMNTHSRHADARMEILASCALMEGADGELARKVLQEVTTDGGLKLCMEAGIGPRVMERVAKQCVHHLRKRCRGEMKIGVVVFSTALSVIGEAGDVEMLREAIAKEPHHLDETETKRS